MGCRWVSGWAGDRCELWRRRARPAPLDVAPRARQRQSYTTERVARPRRRRRAAPIPPGAWTVTLDVPTVLGILLVAAAAGFVLLPIARGTRPEVVASDPGPVDRFGLYRQVLELEFDRELGKLSTADYEELSAELLAAAVSRCARNGQHRRARRRDRARNRRRARRLCRRAPLDTHVARRGRGRPRAAATPS